MTKFFYTVAVETDTEAHAAQVMAERLGYDEQYEDDAGVAFEYSLPYEPGLMSSWTAKWLASIMDDCGQPDGQWNGGDVCQAFAEHIEGAGGWKRCPEHGAFSASNENCPFNHEEPTRQERWADLLAEIHVDHGVATELPAATETPAERYVVVEKSTRDGDYWLTLVDTLDEATNVCDSQEYPEDWSTEYLYDLDTGEQLEPIETTTWR